MHALDTTSEISKPVEFSPKLDLFPGLRVCVLVGGQFMHKVYKVFWTATLFLLTQSAENLKKEGSRFRLSLRQAVILISNVRTSAS